MNDGVNRALTVLLVWLRVDQANKLPWGGARDGGKRRAAWDVSLQSRWVRIFDTGKDLELTTAALADFDVDVARERGSFTAHRLDGPRSQEVGAYS